MPFVVTGTDRTKHITRQYTAGKKAALKAIEMSDRGMSDVAITDLVNGRTYRADELHLLLNESGKSDT